VLRVMAAVAGDFGVSARGRDQLTLLLTVALTTDIHHDLHSRGFCRHMRVLMAGKATGELVAMDRNVALAALRHDRGIVVAPRIKSVEDRVAFTAVKLVPSAHLFDPLKMLRVALATLLQSQRLRICCVKLRVLLGQVRCGGTLLRRGGKNHPDAAEDDESNNSDSEPEHRGYFRLLRSCAVLWHSPHCGNLA